MKKLLKRLLNSRLGHIIILEIMYAMIKRRIDGKEYAMMYYDAYAKLLDTISNDLIRLKDGEKFFSFFDNKEI
jgi:hypothetical protein